MLWGCCCCFYFKLLADLSSAAPLARLPCFGVFVLEQVLRSGRRGCNSGMDAEEEATARLLERVGSEVNRLKFYVQRGQGLPLLEGMLPRIRAAEQALAAALRRCLRAALRRADAAVATRCLLAYAAADDVAGAQTDVREECVSRSTARLRYRCNRMLPSLLAASVPATMQQAAAGTRSLISATHSGRVSGH